MSRCRPQVNASSTAAVWGLPWRHPPPPPPSPLPPLPPCVCVSTIPSGHGLPSAIRQRLTCFGSQQVDGFNNSSCIPPQRTTRPANCKETRSLFPLRRQAEGEPALGVTSDASAHGRTRFWPRGGHLNGARAKREHTI